MVRVRFAPSPTGSLHLGNALTAVANRRFADEHGGVLLLRIDDTDRARTLEGGEAAIVADLEWLDVRWEEGPVRQSDRSGEHKAAAERLLASGRAYEDGGAVRLRGERDATLIRPDGTPTYHLATVVDDLELGVTHVIRGKDHLPNVPLHVAIAHALGESPPEYVHHGLLVGEDGQKLSKRHGLSALADARAAGIPSEAVRRYLAELGLPRGDVGLDLARLRRLATEAIAALPDDELAARVGVPVALAPALRGARDLVEARDAADAILSPRPAPVPPAARPTLERFRELRAPVGETVDEQKARAIVRELKAVGGDLRSVRLALTGRERGPELWAVLAALPCGEAIRRVDAALTAN